MKKSELLCLVRQLSVEDKELFRMVIDEDIARDSSDEQEVQNTQVLASKISNAFRDEGFDIPVPGKNRKLNDSPKKRGRKPNYLPRIAALNVIKENPECKTKLICDSLKITNSQWNNIREALFTKDDNSLIVINGFGRYSSWSITEKGNEYLKSVSDMTQTSFLN